MIPFFNIPNIFNIPSEVKSSYEARRERANDNSGYRNAILALPLQQSLANLNQIEIRIESRIAKEIAGGADMSRAQVSLQTARQSLLRAEIVVSQATSKTDSGAVRPSYIEAHFALNEARDALDEVVDTIAAAATTTMIAAPASNQNAR